MSIHEYASLLVDFDLASGLSTRRSSIQRRLSQMRGMFADQAAYEARLAEEDIVVYEFYDLGLPPNATDVAFGTSITYPGRIGDEYFMTKGHFHRVLEAGEVYYCLRGEGRLVLENPEGACEVRELTAGSAVYVPGRYAHRSVNISPREPLVTFFAFPANAGHDYATIETQGFRKLVVAREGQPTVVDNPRWKE